MPKCISTVHGLVRNLLVLLTVEPLPFALETSVMDVFYGIELETGEVLSPLVYSKHEWATRYRHTPLYRAVKKEGVELQ